MVPSDIIDECAEKVNRREGMLIWTNCDYWRCEKTWNYALRVCWDEPPALVQHNRTGRYQFWISHLSQRFDKLGGEIYTMDL